jgi:c-di-GMP-binding flagellar brake protein YcgR
MPETFSVQMTDSAAAPLAVGMKALVEPSGVGERFASRFVGWFPKRYMLLHLPAQGPVREHLYDGKKLVVRYISCDGQVCGFETEVQGLVFTPQRLLVVHYPRRIAVHSIRQGRRVGVFLGGGIEADDAAHACYILDVSLTGCQAEVRASEHPVPDLAAGKNVVVTFLLPGLTPRQFRLPGVVARVSDQPDGRHRLCGIRFADVPDQDRQDLESYLDEAQRHLGAACPHETGA